MYKPKESLRWKPKVSFPIRLDDLCLEAAATLLEKTGERMSLTSARNIREKKSFRDYISKNLPTSLQQRILEKAVEKLVGATTSLNLLDMFIPDQVARQGVDLLGLFRLGFGCYLKDNRLTWSQGSAKKFNLTLEQCDQLYKILLWSKPAELSELKIAIARGALKYSKLPNILAQARSLTKIVLLSGADNHTMRILGLHCPQLKYLDVSHSVHVTDQGVRNFFLKRPRKAKRSISLDASSQEEILQAEMNPCASTVLAMTLLGTCVSWEGCEFVCRAMNVGYLCSSLPHVKIVRIDPTPVCARSIPFASRSSFYGLECLLSDEKKAVIATSIDSTLLPEDLNQVVIDYYQKHADNGESSVFLRETNSFKLQLHLKLESTTVTSLVLPWYTFTWKLDSLVELDMLGTHFPNLNHFRGRVKGTWSRTGDTLFQHLRVAHVWALNSTTGLSIMQHVPSLKIFEFNNTVTLAVDRGETLMELTDESLEACFAKNTSLANSLIEITIRPSVLTLKSVKYLKEKCRNLARLGDLEAWNVSSQEIGDMNKLLDTEQSQCVLTVMNFPPSKEPTYNMNEIRGET